MTEQEYIDVQNLTAVRIIRTALTLTNADSEIEKYFKKIYDAVSDLTVILNGRVNILEPTEGKEREKKHQSPPPA